MAPQNPLRYRDAGVDIDAQDRALAEARAAIRASFTPAVVGDIGSFGGLFDPRRTGFVDPILVASADGVGTKLEVAKRAGVYHTVGRDLVKEVSCEKPYDWAVGPWVLGRGYETPPGTDA